MEVVIYLNHLVLFDAQVGRKYFRLRLEVGDREADIEQRRVSHMYYYLNQYM
jgi:hypothetical protein